MEFRHGHHPDCPFLEDSFYVENEHCGSPIVWEPQSEVELKFSDGFNFNDKL